MLRCGSGWGEWLRQWPQRPGRAAVRTKEKKSPPRPFQTRCGVFTPPPPSNAPPRNRRRPGSKNQRMRKYNTPTKSKRLTPRVSTITAWSQTVPLNPRTRPATQPQTPRSKCSSRAFSCEQAGVSSKRILPPCETIIATKPHADADATADPTATRQAMLEKGSNFTKNHE